MNSCKFKANPTSNYGMSGDVGLDRWGLAMNGMLLTLAIVFVTISAGCSTPQRSRSLGNPDVPAKALALQVCSNCHGVDGNAGSPNFPNLAGQQQVYFIAQLNDFKSHNRSDPAGFEYMWGLSKYLTEDQIKGLAAYYAEQTPQPGRACDTKRTSEGQEIFEKGIAAKDIPPCATCHGANGQGNELFPRIANQHADYLIKQLKVFQRTDLRPEGASMKAITHSLTEQNMQAVAAYLQAFGDKH